MSVRTIQLLHVEDDPMQQRMIAHHLKAIPEYAFSITTAASEELAMEFFQHTKFDLVLLDYQLVQGNGMHLLGRMRELDPIIPIIAISGVATSQIAAQLVLAGADDYFDKHELTSANLAKSVRASLLRADTVRNKIASRVPDEWMRVTQMLTELCAEYVRRMGPEFIERLDVIALDLQRAQISEHELKRIYEDATKQLEMSIGLDYSRTKRLARPLLFELIVRVCDDR
jgi:DNA-binding response OmpR family regulator